MKQSFLPCPSSYLLPAELIDVFRLIPSIFSLIQFPAPPRPTRWTVDVFDVCRRSSSSKSYTTFSVEGCMLPAPPRPVVNLGCAEGGKPPVKREAGPWAVVGDVVGGALK